MIELEAVSVAYGSGPRVVDALTELLPAPLGPISPSHSPDATRSVKASTTRGPEP